MSNNNTVHKKKRPCLRCDEPTWTDAHNRLCKYCKGYINDRNKTPTGTYEHFNTHQSWKSSKPRHA